VKRNERKKKKIGKTKEHDASVKQKTSRQETTTRSRTMNIKTIYKATNIVHCFKQIKTTDNIATTIHC